MSATELEISDLPFSAAPSAAIARSYAGLAITVCCWGLLPVLLKQLLYLFSPLEIAFLRFLFSGNLARWFLRIGFMADLLKSPRT